MNLINKFTLWYLLITLLVLLAGGVIIYKNISEEINKEEAREIATWLDDIAHRIEKGVPLKKLNRDPVEIKLISPDAAIIPFYIKDTMAMHQQLQRIERHLKGSASYKINGIHYYISTYDIMVESDDIVEAVQKAMVWIIGLLLVFVFMASRLISAKILRPFHVTLQAIQSFHLNQKNDLTLERSSTKEFNDLNAFLLTMTEKAKQDYQSLKEFTENASHEMQTPLAIIRGKLELLMEAESKDEQARLILTAHDAVEKLSRMGQALTLLTKLSNQEFVNQESVNLSELVLHKIATFQDLIEMKSITITSYIDEEVRIHLNSTLADILLNNLFSNAIRHNACRGTIDITLTQHSLIMRNTGEPLSIAADELFKRFKKGNQYGDSVGLGLAIVKQICTLNQYLITYQYKEGWHSIEVKWK